MDSHTSPSSEASQARQELAVQEAWLYNMLPPSPKVCTACRGICDDRYPTNPPLCFPCKEVRRKAGSTAANTVFPISYAPDGEQHYHYLKVYKSPLRPSVLALRRLAILYAYFVATHQECLERAAGGTLTHVAAVPSTRSREGVHPLRKILELVHKSAPYVTATVNEAYGNDRGYFEDRFQISPFPDDRDPPRVLLLEDLWVTGGRAQSMAHALKAAGAASVVLVALGRRVNSGYEPSRPLLEAAKRVRPFALGRCALDDLE